MAFYSFENIDQAAQFAPKFNRIGPAIPKWRAVKLAYFKNAQKRPFFKKLFHCQILMKLRISKC